MSRPKSSCLVDRARPDTVASIRLARAVRLLVGVRLGFGHGRGEVGARTNPKALAAVQIPDGVFEPFRFCLAFLATARLNGAVVRTYSEVTDVICSGKSVTGVKVKDYRTGKTETLGADMRHQCSGSLGGGHCRDGRREGSRVSLPQASWLRLTAGSTTWS